MMNVVHLCDCMEFMKGIPDKYYELAIVDPPYGINWMEQIKNPNTGKNWKQYESKSWDKSTPSKDYFNEIKRVSKNQIIWGANYFEGMTPTPCWVIWDKQQEFSGATFEMAWTSFSSPAKAFRMARCEAYVGINKIHPTQKPVALYKWLLQNYAKPGDKIFDSHVGSGSIRIACHEMGFDFEGCEIDKDYWEAQERRYRIFLAQPDLFAPKATYAEQPDIF
jgi:site-specific DNA-methyltransferase (adenine-specific)